MAQPAPKTGGSSSFTSSSDYPPPQAGAGCLPGSCPFPPQTSIPAALRPDRQPDAPKPGRPRKHRSTATVPQQNRLALTGEFFPNGKPDSGIDSTPSCSTGRTAAAVGSGPAWITGDDGSHLPAVRLPDCLGAPVRTVSGWPHSRPWSAEGWWRGGTSKPQPLHHPAVWSPAEQAQVWRIH